MKLNRNEKKKELFYSCFYHSITKPSNWFGESFIYEKGKPVYVDFATLWDMYKTQLPLVFMLYKDEAEEICETILSMGEALGHIPVLVLALVVDRMAVELGEID